MNKSSIVSFKADKSLAEALKSLSNRSEFIRSAILAALDSTCPFCEGTGSLTPDGQKHWKHFTSAHGISECPECKAGHLEPNSSKKARRS